MTSAAHDRFGHSVGDVVLNRHEMLWEALRQEEWHLCTAVRVCVLLKGVTDTKVVTIIASDCALRLIVADINTRT